MTQQGIGNQVYSLLKECTSLKCGRRIQALMVLNGLHFISFLADYLIRLFGTCGSLIEANQAFANIESPSAYTWSSIINTHAKSASGNVALDLYMEMLLFSGTINEKPIYVAALKACVIAPDLRLIHAHILGYELRSDIVVGSTLIDMYARCNSLDEAFNLFQILPIRNVVSWSSMISGFAKHDEAVLALECFKWMQEEHIAPNQVTFSSLLNACANKRDVEWTRYFHEQIITGGVKCNVIVGSALLDAYAKCGCLQEACQVFEHLPERNVVTWAAMIDGHAQLGECSLALDCFERMQKQGIRANEVTYSFILNGYALCGDYLCALQMYNIMKHEGVKSDKLTFLGVLKACRSITAITEGSKCIHEEVIECGLQLDPMIANALIDMYARYGNLREAHKIFNKLPSRDIVSWNALLAGHARQGSVKMVRDCLWEMEREGIKPNAATFISILAACSHAGLVDEGRGYFRSMRIDYDLVPEMRHHSCMVDLLGRAGHLIQAWELLTTQSNIIGWKSLLSACGTYGNLELGRQCFHEVMLLNSHDPAGAFI